MATNTALVTKLELDLNIEPMKKYKLVMHNDDTTPFDLVIGVMVEVCLLPINQAVALTMQIHEQGSGVVLEGTMEFIKTKQDACKSFMTRYGFSNFAVTVEE